MTYDDLMAAPLFGANRHVFDCDECKRPDKWAAYEVFGDMRNSTQEEVDAFNKMLADMSIPFHATVDDIVAVAERMERQEQAKCDEYVVAYPRVTSEDLTANHAAGLPVTRERIVRCKDCYYFRRDMALYDADCPHFCAEHGIDMAEDDGFCSWAREAE